MPKIVEYFTIEERNSHLIDKEVNAFIKEGWQPFGSLAMSTGLIERAGALPEFETLFCQPVVKYADERPAPAEKEKHYLIIGGYIKEPTGCTWGQMGMDDVLSEDPKSTFQEINPLECPICQDMGLVPVPVAKPPSGEIHFLVDGIGCVNGADGVEHILRSYPDAKLKVVTAEKCPNCHGSNKYTIRRR